MKLIQKVVISSSLALTLLSVGAVVTINVLDNAKKFEQREQAEELAEYKEDLLLQEEIEEEEERNRLEDEEAAAELELLEQTSEVGGIEDATGLDEFSSLEEIVDVMHKMTHQKVVAQDKWGAIQMTVPNKQEVRNALKNGTFEEDTDELIRIIEKWENGDYSSIDEDHNHFWEKQEGNIGQATGILSKTDEEEFIKNNFKK